ncbi:general secretion pathway protein GspB [Lysobacter koreensis]|uniref:General secretion pathway protein GspB n=1 Tax=Lysobacter koreensis TaxID=266122 RepID=A0ABW2YQ27_9GAMM
MSMILDALRKSEAERRRAQAPDLFAEPVVVAQPRAVHAPRWLWWTLAAIVVLLVTWLARGLWSPSGAGDPPLARQAERPAEMGEQSPMADPSPARVAATDAPAPTRAAAAEPTAAMPAATAPPPAGAASQPAPPLVAPVAIAVPPRPAPTPVPPPVPAADPPLAEPVAPPSAPAPAPAPAIVAAPDAPGTLRLSDLSAGERRQLPPLKISMHMWASAPNQRFVIIDGQRSGEGDRVGEAVIEEITADGVVIAWAGRRLKLALR